MALGYSMANNSTPPTDFDNSDLMNYIVRMVIPMRREFSRALDVSHFLHDFAYAQEIIEQAKGSKDARLCEYAIYLEGRMTGPRNSTATAPPLASAPVPAPTQTSASALPNAEPTEAMMRERMMNKYKSGLR
jgi:hypothetical protein